MSLLSRTECPMTQLSIYGKNMYQKRCVIEVRLNPKQHVCSQQSFADNNDHCCHQVQQDPAKSLAFLGAASFPTCSNCVHRCQHCNFGGLFKEVINYLSNLLTKHYNIFFSFFRYYIKDCIIFWASRLVAESQSAPFLIFWLFFPVLMLMQTPQI